MKGEEIIQTQQKPKEFCHIPLKATLQFHPIFLKCYYYQNHIVCQSQDQIMIYNTLTKNKQMVKINYKDCLLAQMPPYLFAVFEDRFIHGYKMGLASLDEPVHIRISKLEPRAICRYNKGFFIGGYNRSFLPGNRRTTTRDIYFIENFKLTQKNKADDTIRLRDSNSAVSMLQVQNPYLFAYCHPVAYLISIYSKNILITFQKNAINLLLLEGRFAISSTNGIGLSAKQTLFTFDIQKYPIFGVQITQSRRQCTTVCMEKTGRIFGAKDNQVFQYNPIRQQVTNLVLYPKGEKVRWITCTPSNSLMVLRTTSSLYSSIDVFSLE